LGDEYLSAIERVDAHLTRLHEVIEKRVQEHGEKWLLVMVTDHGHRDEGGHGGDSEQERASFVIAHGIGRNNPQWSLDIEPHHLTDLLLAERA
jgi:predicted AlkP superfamily pyrophosphatase or phosphodiesterase